MSTAKQTPDAAQAETSIEQTPSGPVIEVHGPATAEDVAALVAVLSAASGGDGAAGGERTPYRSTWASPANALRGPLRHGRGAWGAANRG